MNKFALSTAAYVVICMILGMSWHFVIMKDVYDGLKIYNRVEPIIPLGLSSMLVQGLVMAYLYPFYRTSDAPIMRGLKFSLILGLLLFSVSTLANGAKIEVTSMATWLWVQTAFHLIQFVLVGIAFGLIHRHNDIRVG